jgi:hypothetical protein
MYGQQNKHKWLLVIAFLATVMGDLSANAQALYKAGRINPRDAELAVRKVVVAGGTVNLLDNAGQASVKGVNDFDGNRLTSGRNFVIDAITINYGVGTTGTTAAAIDFSTALPPALKTANLVIKQDDRVIRRLSIASINEAKSTDLRFRELEGFALLVEETTTSIEIEFGAGTAFSPGAGNDAYVECILKGFETNIKR